MHDFMRRVARMDGWWFWVAIVGEYCCIFLIIAKEIFNMGTFFWDFGDYSDIERYRWVDLESG
jgi:hypothetical protein